MTDEAISPLRRRMIEDMTIRKLAPKTQHDYVQRVKNFAAFLGRSPDTASFEDVRRYQLHLAASGVGVPTLNQTVSTLRFFFRVTLKRQSPTHSSLAAPSNNLLRHIARDTPQCAGRPNPHSARRTTTRAHARGFLPRRLSDAGPRSTRLPHSWGRHPKPFTTADIHALCENLSSP